MSSGATPKPRLGQQFWASPVTRILIFLVLYGVIAEALSLVPQAALRLLHHRPGSDQTLIALVSEALFAPAPILAAWVMVRSVDKRPWATAGFTRLGLAAGLLGGFAVGAALLTAIVGALRLLGAYHITGIVPGALLLVPLALYLGVAVSEETLFRGYLFQTLEGRWGSGVALAATSLLFGLLHLGNPAPGVTPLERLAGPLFICLEAGLPFGAAYLLTRRLWLPVTRRLWLPVGIHWGWDFFEGPVYGCPDSGTRDPHALFQAYFSGPSFITGGGFGPEAGVVSLTVGTLAGLLLLRAAIRRGQWHPWPRRAS